MLYSSPLCFLLSLPQVYEYLQDPPSHAHTLALVHHPLVAGELAATLRVLVSSKKLRSELRKLVLHNCELGDQDCQLLAQCLPQFPGLVHLALKMNNITSTGLGDVMRVGGLVGGCPSLSVPCSLSISYA